MDDSAPADMLYDTLVKLFLIVNDSDRHVLAQHGLTLPRFHVLQHLHNEPGISFAQLSTLMLTDRANVSRIVRGMELDGLVTRCLNEKDRRSYLLQLTARGADVHAQAAAAHRNDLEARFEGCLEASSRQVQPDLMNRLRTLTNELADHLETLRQPAGA